MNMPSLEEQKERGLKFLESANPKMAEMADDSDAINAYRESVMAIVYLGEPHPLSLVKAAIRRLPHNPQIGEKTLMHVLDGIIVRHFNNVEERDIYMLGLQDSNVSIEEIEPKVFDFLEPHLKVKA